jgi:hypothetical protein
MPIRPHRSALGEARASVAALIPSARGHGGGGGGGEPIVWDHRNYANADLTLLSDMGNTFQYGGFFGNAVPTVARITSAPFFVGGLGMTVRAMGIEKASGGNTGVGRLGIYKMADPSARSNYPTTLMRDFGEVVVGVASQVYTTAEDPISLPNGMYFAAFLLESGNCSLQHYQNPQWDDVFLGWTYTATTVAPNNAIYVDGVAAGGLPTTFPAGGAFAVGSDSAGAGPVISIVL